MIYFCENKQSKEMKPGYATRDGYLSRINSHRLTGFVFVCGLPGEEQDEDRILDHFAPHLKRGREWFHNHSSFFEYFEKLLERDFAHPAPERALELPDLPYTIWGPEYIKSNAIDLDGQISLWSRLPVRERVERLSKQAQNHSVTDEWYTPEWLVNIAKEVLGSIDTDPATSAPVNRMYIQAKIWYTKHTNGLDLSRPWSGRVWLNPPYGIGDSKAGNFVKRLCEELNSGNVVEAITCLNQASMSSKWFYGSVPERAAVHCILNGRPNFIPPAGKKATSPNKGTVISYFGNNKSKFIEVFKSCGQILLPYVE